MTVKQWRPEMTTPGRFPATLYPALFMARLTVAMTWGWSLMTKRPWTGDSGWLADAIIISQHYTWVPGWAGVADVLLENIAIVGALVMLLELYLFVTLLFGFMTRFNGYLATLWAGVIVILAVSIPKGGVDVIGDPGPDEFPVPIGGWVWLLAPLVILPLASAMGRAGRLFGLDAWLQEKWIGVGGLRGLLAKGM